MLIGRIVGQMGDVKESVRLAAALADVASGRQHGEPKGSIAKMLVQTIGVFYGFRGRPYL